MAAQPCLSAADVESLLESMKTAEALLNNIVAEGKSTLNLLDKVIAEGHSTLKCNTIFINGVHTYPEQRDSARERRHPNDKNMTPLHHGLAEYGKIPRLAGHGLADQDEGLHLLLQHQRQNLDPLELGLNAHPDHNPLLYGGLGRLRRLLNHDSTPYDAADEQMVSGQREHCANRGALPHGTPDDRFIFDNERHDHAHGHRYGHDRLPLISDFKPGSLLGTDHNSQDPHSRQGLHRGLDTGHCDIKSLGPQPKRVREARLDNNYNNYLSITPRPHHQNLESANVRAPWHHSTDYPFPDGSKDHRIGKDLCEAQARQTLENGSTRHLAPLLFPEILGATTATEIDHQARQTLENRSTRHRAPLIFPEALGAPTAAGIDHWSSQIRIHNESDAGKRRLEQMRAQLRQQSAGTCGVLKRKADHIGRPPRPAPNLFNDDLEQLPHHCYDVPFRPHTNGTMRAYTAREDGVHYPMPPIQPVQQVDDLNRPRVAVALSTALSKAAIDDTFHGHQHAQGPVVDAKRSNTARNNSGVGAITDPSNNDENPVIPSQPSSDSSESSESGYDTPDFDESSDDGDEDKDDAEGLEWVGM